MEVTSIRAAAAGIYRRQVTGSQLPETANIATVCDAWLMGRDAPTDLLSFFKDALDHLKNEFPSVKKPELQAHFAFRAIAKCVDLS